VRAIKQGSMAIYKFRVTFEDYEDIYRDIEIRASNTFYDFHEIILQSISFDNKHAASFFVSDDFWRKGTEITLLQEDIEPGVKLMKNIKISSCIEQPNQRFIYLYDKKVLWSFLIELIKLVPEDVKVKYPRCLKSVGQAPKQYKQQVLDKLKAEQEQGLLMDKAPKEEEPARRIAKEEEKLVYDEHEEDDLHDDENATAGEEGEEHDHEGEGGADEEHEPGAEGHEEDNW
jgi:hypothetical protein